MAAFERFTQRYNPTQESSFKSAIPLLLEQLNKPKVNRTRPQQQQVNLQPVPQTQSPAIQQTPQPRPLGPGQVGGTDMQRLLSALAERRRY